MATRTSGETEQQGKRGALPLQVAHRIEVLLHTMRAIERHEEQLCVVMTEIRNEGDVSAATRQELEALLEELPSKAYQADLHAVATALHAMEAEGGKPKVTARVATGRGETAKGKTRTRQGADRNRGSR